jgi:phasin
MTEHTTATRKHAEKATAQTKDTYEKVSAVTEETTDLIRNAYSTAAKDIKNYNLKILEIAQANTNAFFDYVQELVGVKSPSEFAEVSSAYGSRQIEAMTKQTKELGMIAQKAATESAESLTTGVHKASGKLV